MSRHRYLNATIIVLLVGYHLSLGPQGARAEERTLWQIGKFDQSSEEFGFSFGFGSLSSVRSDPVYQVGSSTTAFIPQYSYQKLTIQIPTTALKQCENKLVLTCVDDPFERDDSYGTVGIGDSGILYDALELSQDEVGKFQSRSIQASIVPTVFYKKGSSGLTEVVEAIISLNERVPKGTVALEVPGWHQSADLSYEPDFPEQVAAFDVPAWNGSVDARLRARAGGTRNFDVKVDASRRWTVYVVPHTHLDIGYTDYQGKVAEAQPRVLSQAAELVRQLRAPVSLN